MTQPQVSIRIDGKALNTFTSLTLHQPMYDHHTFQLVVGHDIIEDEGSHVLDRSRYWSGKDFHLSFGDNAFAGVVTSVALEHQDGLNGDLVVSGASRTILLEAGAHRQAWNDKTLKWIVQDMADKAGVKADVSPLYKETIEYMAQHGESHFAFLRRLAATFQEWMYYDGRRLVFGTASGSNAAVKLVHGTDLHRIRMEMRVLPVRRQGYSYHSGMDETLHSRASGHVGGLDSMGSVALGASKKLFGLAAQGPMPVRVPDKYRLDMAVERLHAADAARLSAITASGTAMALRPGVVAEVSAAVRNGKEWKLSACGRYVVTDIRHHFTGNDTYHNSFEGIPAGLMVPPAPLLDPLVAMPELATVVSNADPRRQGRVQVRFHWQDDQSASPWLRVMTNDAGTSDKVGTNRGLVTIPEEGDQVMVGFRYGDPMRPFVMGSLFHGASAGGGGQGNKTKSLTTRSGCTMSLDDDHGSITISDPSGNTVILHGDGKMTITAPNELTLSSKVIKIEAGDKIDMKGTNKVNIDSNEITGKGTMKVTLSSIVSVDISSPITAIKGDNLMKVEGMMVDITGSAITNVQGGTVNLN
jgi:phage protein D